MKKDKKSLKGDMVEEIYSDDFKWIRYNFDYNPFSDELAKHSQQPLSSARVDEINSMGYRSDEFTKSHKGMHILFTGCSQTYGCGIEEHEMWSTNVLNEIKTKNNVSGNFNISYLARGPHNIINEIIKYCKLYGNPDKIFILFPDHRRFMGFEEYDQKFKQYVLLTEYEYDKLGTPKLEDEKWKEIFRVTFHFYYKMLELYCEQNNIDLLSMCWQSETNEIIKDYNFKTFKDLFENQKLYNYMLEHTKKSEDKTYCDTARDGCHLGTSWHYAFYKIFMEHIIND